MSQMDETKIEDARARFVAKVDMYGTVPVFRPDFEPCWVWTGLLDRDGYGRTPHNHLTHRVAYELFVGPILEGLEIDHLCRVRACVNPDHLEAVTHQENMRRGYWGVLMTHCKHGHELTPENSYVRPSGTRSCRACNRASVAAYNARKATRERVPA